jgi:hypothetical protein
MLLGKCEICGTLVNESEQERMRMIMLNRFNYVDGKCLCAGCRKDDMEIKNLLCETLTS